MNLSKSYLPPIEKGIIATMAHGAFAGYPMSNVKVIVYDGKEHPVDSKKKRGRRRAAPLFLAVNGLLRWRRTN